MVENKNKLYDSSGKIISSKPSQGKILNNRAKAVKKIAISAAAGIALLSAVFSNFETISSVALNWYNPDRFSITDILSSRGEGGSKVLDFRLLNNTDKTVTISRVRLTVISYKHDLGCIECNSISEVSGTYEVSLEELKQEGDFTEVGIAHVVKPGEDDRFQLVLGIEPRSGYFGESYTWKLKPSLTTSEGEVVGSAQSISIP